MSKRAEELAEKVLQVNGFGIVHKDDIPTVVFLIDAELRKERERAAAIAIGTINTAILFASVKGETIDWPCTPDELRSAILAEEED